MNDTAQDKNRENAILNFYKIPKSSEEILNFIALRVVEKDYSLLDKMKV